MENIESSSEYSISGIQLQFLFHSEVKESNYQDENVMPLNVHTLTAVLTFRLKRQEMLNNSYSISKQTSTPLIFIQFKQFFLNVES